MQGMERALVSTSTPNANVASCGLTCKRSAGPGAGGWAPARMPRPLVQRRCSHSACGSQCACQRQERRHLQRFLAAEAAVISRGAKDARDAWALGPDCT